jgi:glucose/arabinose dehydrogenase/single-stranded DNA-binding protein
MLTVSPAHAAPPSGFVNSLIVGAGLNQPSGFDIAPDGRIFVLERAGKVRIVKNGQLLAQPFADLPSVASGDRGLIGIAFDPQFGVANNYVYFYYTGLDLLNHLVRFDASGDVGAEGPFQIFATQSPSQELHVGGSIAFGPDGKLYFAVGDNGYPPNAQDLTNPHGKIHRINSDGSIPSDNPFYGQPGKVGSIWAYGFRNPWRFQFDSATGQLYVGDVGDASWEELNHVVRGGNYGWPLAEGMCAANCTGLINPIYTYPHNGQSAAVTSGPVYRGTMFPAAYRGALFFGDYAQGFIKTAQLDSSGNVTAVNVFEPAAGTVVDLKVAADGSLYYVDIFPGELHRISYNTTSHPPTAVASASTTQGVQPLQVQFSSAGSSDPDGNPLTFQWDFGDGTTSASANPVKTFSTRGVYTVRLTVSDGVNQTAATPIVVQVGLPPTLNISAPTNGALYRAGDTISYGASAVDYSGATLPDTAFTTEVRFHHGTHVHPFLGPLTSRAGTFTIPTTGEESADTWYEVIIKAADRDGVSTTKSVSIYPRKTHITLKSNPPGLTLTLDGVPTATPYTTEAVVGFQRELAAPPTAVAANGAVYHFMSWSDGQPIRHVITATDADSTYTATYALSAPFVGEYFANRNLTGMPVLTRADPSINFIWNLASPGPAVPADNFSVRWSKTEYFAAGRYKFTTVTDDGVRLYIDGQLVIDQWRDQSGTAHDGIVDLGSGNHTVRMDYFDSGWDALATLTWDTTKDQPTTWLAEYWNTPGAGAAPAMPTGPAVVTRQEAAIDYAWWLASPAPGIDSDHFVARWTRVMALPAGTYTFSATADDGVRVYVDGQLLIDRWVDQGATTYTATVAVSGGTHTVKMEYYENAWDATAKLTWSLAPDQPTTWLAQYWNTHGAGAAPAMPTSLPVVSRQEATVDHDWWLASPAAGIDSDHFVARWTRVMNLAVGTYTFTVTADDGVRLYVDGQLLIDRWVDQSATTYTTSVALAGGAHTVVVEYYENAWDATVHASVGNAV